MTESQVTEARMWEETVPIYKKSSKFSLVKWRVLVLLCAMYLKLVRIAERATVNSNNRFGRMLCT